MKSLCHAESPSSEGQEPAHLRRLGWPTAPLKPCTCVGGGAGLGRCSHTYNQTPFLPQGNPEEHTILEFAQLIKDLVGK